MSFRRAEIEKICQLVDDSKRKYPPPFEEKQRTIAQIGKIVAANNLIQSSHGAKKLSDDSVTILIVILMRR